MQKHGRIIVNRKNGERLWVLVIMMKTVTRLVILVKILDPVNNCVFIIDASGSVMNEITGLIQLTMKAVYLPIIPIEY